MTPAEPKSEALRALYWRDEILQVMFWLRGEGFGDHADAPLIERFLGVDANIGIGYLDRLVEEGYLIRDAAHYRLTEQGIDQGGRIFSEEFAEFMRPTHGECGPDCWCHSSAEDAEACLQALAEGLLGRPLKELADRSGQLIGLHLDPGQSLGPEALGVLFQVVVGQPG